MAWDPRLDGVDHINIYSRGRTELGRAMSNLADVSPPLKLGQHGEWRTIEGFWYYTKLNLMGCGGMIRMEELFDLQVGNGFTCKKVGQAIMERTVKHHKKLDMGKFRSVMGAALLAKANRPGPLSTMLAQSTLPFAHYYVQGNYINPVYIPANPEHDWQLDVWATIRRGYQHATILD